jgi:antirestriction protein ArdC
MTKEEKQNLVDSYQKKIDEHFLSIVDKVADYFIIESDKNIPVWESDVFKNSFYNPESGTQYNFENTLLLWLACKENKYQEQRFVTAKQAFDSGMSMEKGTKGHQIVQRFGMPMFPLFKRDESGEIIKDSKTNKPIPDRDEDGKVKYVYQRVSKLVTVFNLEQLKGDIPKRWNKTNVKLNLENETELQLFKKSLEESSAVKINRIATGDNFYSPSKDEITLSNSKLFKNTLNEISVMAHEMSHATGHQDRLNRESLYKYNSHKSYRGFEELVANFSARALTEKYGLSNNEFKSAYEKNHDAYDAGWMQHVLKENPMKIFEATQMAESAFRMINNPLVEKLKQEPMLKDIYFPDKESTEIKEYLKNSTTKKRKTYNRKK